MSQQLKTNTSSKEDENLKYIKLDYDTFDSIPQLVNSENAENLFAGIDEYGFKIPSAIQSRAISVICDKKDLIAQSRSGTGKTGAFVIGMLSKINVHNHVPQAIIIANSGTLAVQINDVACEIAKSMNIKITLCIGGSDDGKNKSSANYNDARNSHILIGCPGRLNDLIERSEYNTRGETRWKLTNEVDLLIIDEADEMLKDAFQPAIISILERLKKTTQLCAFSATYNTDVADKYSSIMNRENVIKLLIDDSEVKINSIKNYVIELKEEEYKFCTLLDLYKRITFCQCIIFVNTVKKAIELGKALAEETFSISVMHRELTEKERRDSMKKFRIGNSRILISTDIIARGIDVEQVGLVINYDIPTSPEQYIHRVGRSGRYGKTGVAVNFATSSEADRYNIEDVIKTYNIVMNKSLKISELTKYLTGPDGYNFIQNESN
jgi:hypothetical protein